MSKKRIAIAGGFDPIHAGHIDHIEKAAALGDHLTVITCPDDVLILKKGFCMVPLADRLAVLRAIGCVDEVIVGDYIETSCAPTLMNRKYDIFAKGGDRIVNHMDPREIAACALAGTEIRYGIGDQLNSSSRLARHAPLGKVLIIAPHPDDEVLGCASFLIDMPERVTVAYVTFYHPSYPDLDNVAERRALGVACGYSVIQMRFGRLTNQLDLPGQNSLIGELTRLVDEEKPRTVLIPAPSYNQDHRAVYDAALTAMRPHDRNFFVKHILLYEQPETFGTMRKPAPFNPTYFRYVDPEVKQRLYEYYQTQQRGHRSEEHLAAIATVRGMQVNSQNAEAFEVVRWTE